MSGSLPTCDRRRCDYSGPSGAGASPLLQRPLWTEPTVSNVQTYQPPAYTPQLTVRQRQIASLAAGGLTSPQIAAQLYLSVRTVDNHLATVYLKLGVNSRAKLSTVRF